MGFDIFIRGFLISAGLIVAIGAQNAFVLRSGLRRFHRFKIALVCSLCDALLIAMGCFGSAWVISRFEGFSRWMTYLGAAFLFVYGTLAFRSAWKAKKVLDLSAHSEERKSGWVVLTALAFSLLNPHVYLDTVVIMGSIAAPLAIDERLAFWVGGFSASFLWFFGLAYGSSFLIPLFKKEIAWRILDIFIGCVMWGIAGLLLVRG